MIRMEDLNQPRAASPAAHRRLRDLARFAASSKLPRRLSVVVDGAFAGDGNVALVK